MIPAKSEVRKGRVLERAALKSQRETKAVAFHD